MPLSTLCRLLEPSERFAVELDKRIACVLQRVQPKCKWGWEIYDDDAGYIVLEYRGTPAAFFHYSEIRDNIVKVLDTVDEIIKEKENDIRQLF